MGTKYYIINRQNMTAYDLGKGGWDELNYDKEALSDLEYLTQYVLDECYNLDILTEQKRNEITTHVTQRVAPDLYLFCSGANLNDIFIFNDCGDDITICRSLGYRFVGHRYHEVGDKQYLEHLKFLNRHFDENDNLTHYYAKMDWYNHPDYHICMR